MPSNSPTSLILKNNLHTAFRVGYNEIAFAKVSNYKLTLICADFRQFELTKTLTSFIADAPVGMFLRTHRDSAVSIPYIKQQNIGLTLGQRTLDIPISGEIIKVHFSRNRKGLIKSILGFD